MNFSVNGVSQTNDSLLGAQVSINSNGAKLGEIELIGLGRVNDSLTIMEIIILSKNDVSIALGTYTDTMSNVIMNANYNSYVAGCANIMEANSFGVNLSDHLVLTITSISASSVAGTFSGDFFRYGNYTSPLHITNGSFNAKIR